MPSKKSSAKVMTRSNSPVRKRRRVTLARLLPGKDYPMFDAPDPHVVIPGVAWADKNGYSHVKKLSQRDARTVLARLKLEDQEANDAFGAMLFGNPLYWLQAYAKDGGDFSLLHIRCKKEIS